MKKILFTAAVNEEGNLTDNDLETLNAAIEIKEGLGGSLSVALIGKQAAAAADSIANCGAENFYTISSGETAVSRYATDTAAIEALVKKAEADIIIGFSSMRLMRAMPGVAYRLGGHIDTHISGYQTDNGLSVRRWYYRQRMEATLKREHSPWFLLLDKGLKEPFKGEKGSANPEEVAVTFGDDLENTTVIGMESPQSGTQTIKPEAELLFVAGAGWTKKQADGEPHLKEAEEIILNALKTSGASLGSSKSLVDLGAEGEEVLNFMSHLNQVGQTGSTPRHARGLATCCHGEEPHVIGWRFIKERRAINIDANCGWAQGKTDVLYVADAFAVMKKVNEILAG